MIPQQHTFETPYLVGAVHCYSMEINDELILFDSGPPLESAKQYLQQNLPLERLKHVVMTHCHIEHYGLADWLSKETDATIYVPYRDHIRISRHHENMQHIYTMLADIGFSSAFLAKFQKEIDTPGLIYPDPPVNYKIIQAELPPELGIEFIPCPGHSQSDLALCRENWAITGDIMLRNIFQTPLLEWDFHTNERFHNYSAYCHSLANMASLRGKTILPGHRFNIDSVGSCLLFYLNKLLDRASLLIDFPVTAKTADILDKIIGINTDFAFASYAKASEIIFLRDFLAEPERLRQAAEGIGLFAPLADKYHQLCGALQRKAC